MPARLDTRQNTFMRSPLEPGALPRRVHRALEHLYALVSEELERQLERMLTELEQQLFRQAEQARSSNMQAEQFEALRNLRQHRNELVPRYLAALESALTRLREPAAAGGKAAASLPFNQMRLLDDSEISEESLLRSIGLRHESRAGLPLMLLGQRFGVLAGAPAFDAERLPVGPYALGIILAESSQVLQLSLDARLLLFRCFEQQVMGGYAQLVETMNALLARENVLPSLSYVPLRSRASTPAPAERADAGRQSRRARHGAGGSVGGGGESRFHGGPGIDLATTRPHTAWLGETDAGGGEPGGEQDVAFAMLQQLLSSRRELLGKLRADPQSGSRRALPTADVVAALENQQVPQAGAAGGRRSMADIKQTLLAQSRQLHGQAASLSPEDNDTFELLGMLYAEISRELREGAPSAALVERLQVPVLRLALQDRAFFGRNQHPARQLLNAVAEAGARWLSEDETDPQLESRLRGAVDHVVDNYHGDAGVFDAANQSLQDHLQVMARKAEVSERRHVEAARGKEKLELAKRRAAEVIEQAVVDQPLPRFVRTLLAQAWTDVLTLTLLRHGDDSEEWLRHIEDTSQIVAVSAGTATAAPGLDLRVEHALNLVGYHADEASAIARRLTQGREQGEEDPASRTELAMKLKARARLGDGGAAAKATRPPRTALEQSCYEHLRTLPFGTWIEFVQNQQGDVVRRRLAWYSPMTDHALFVNQRGQRVDEQSLDQLARMISAKQAHIVTTEKGRLVDRAWNAAVSALKGFAGLGGRPAEGKA